MQEIDFEKLNAFVESGDTLDPFAIGINEPFINKFIKPATPKKHGKKDIVERFTEAFKSVNIAPEKLNPFLEGFELVLKTKAGEELKAEPVFDKNGNLIETKLRKVVFYDPESFIKIFPAKINWLVNFSPRALKLFIHLINQYSTGGDCKDFVELIPPRKGVKGDITFTNKKGEEEELSRSSFYFALEELRELRILEKRSGHTYWINPTFMFNGNRVTLIENFIARTEKKEGCLHLGKLPGA